MLIFCWNKASTFFGAYDKWLSFKVVVGGFRIVYWLLAAGLICMGILSFIDWCSLKAGKQPKYGFLRFSFSEGKSSPADPKVSKLVGLRRFFSFVFLCIIAGSVMALLASFWPENFSLYLNYYFLMQGNLMGAAVLSFYLYALGLAMPLILVWLGALAFSQPSMNIFRQKRNSLITIVASAVFLSVGASVVVTLINTRF